MRKIAAIFIMCLLSLPALADKGPKENITVILKNMPAGDVYVDLLVNNQEETSKGEQERQNRRQECIGIGYRLSRGVASATARKMCEENTSGLSIEGKEKRAAEECREEYAKKEKKGERFNPKMLDVLKAYNKDGWRSALTHCRFLLWGELTGNDERSFNYFGTPEIFKIIAVDENGNITVSNVLERTELRAEVTFDLATGKAEIKQIPVRWNPFF